MANIKGLLSSVLADEAPNIGSQKKPLVPSAANGRRQSGKVKRYWPGKVPEYASEARKDDVTDLASRGGQRSKTEAVVIHSTREKFAPKIIKAAGASAALDLGPVEDDTEEAEKRRARGRGRRRDDDEDTEQEDVEPMKDEFDDDRTARDRIREQALSRQDQEVGADSLEARMYPMEEESESESEYESETESEEDDAYSRPMLKPVFVPKGARDTIAEKERIEKEEEALKLRRKNAAKERRKESRQLVAEEIRKTEERAEQRKKKLEGGEESEVDEEEEFEKWKLRELLRIKRDRDERRKMEEEKAEIERRRNLTDGQREMEDREWRIAHPTEKKKSKHAFLQKYYHKGAFFVGETEEKTVLDANYGDAPTLEDKYDKTILPSVMQVKNFGRKGRTKWTHLVAEDTTVGESMKPIYEAPLVKAREKLGGTGEIERKRRKKH